MITPRPPLGLRPAKAAVGYPRNLRIHEIACAMLRYTVAGARIPIEWADELVSLADPARDLPSINTSRHNGLQSLSDARTRVIQEVADELAQEKVRFLQGTVLRMECAAREACAARTAWVNKPWWRRAYDAIRRPEILL